MSLFTCIFYVLAPCTVYLKLSNFILFSLENDDMESSKRCVKLLSLIFIIICLTKSYLIRKYHARKILILRIYNYIKCKYLLLNEFEGRTVSYGPRFFSPRFMAQARSARAINRRGKNEDPLLTVRTEKTRLVRYLLYL